MSRNGKSMMKQGGFTLIELIVVIGILAAYGATSLLLFFRPAHFLRLAVGFGLVASGWDQSGDVFDGAASRVVVVTPIYGAARREEGGHAGGVVGESETIFPVMGHPGPGACHPGAGSAR